MVTLLGLVGIGAALWLGFRLEDRLWEWSQREATRRYLEDLHARDNYHP